MTKLLATSVCGVVICGHRGDVSHSFDSIKIWMMNYQPAAVSAMLGWRGREINIRKSLTNIQIKRPTLHEGRPQIVLACFIDCD